MEKGARRRGLEERVQSSTTREEPRPEAAGSTNQDGERGLTFPVTDAVGWHGPPNMDDATTVGHFILVGVLARVIIIQGMHDAQIEKEFVQNLKKSEAVSYPSRRFTARARLSHAPPSLAP